MHWDKLSLSEMDTQINHALSINMNYKTNKILGVPASYLDEKQFSIYLGNGMEKLIVTSSPVLIVPINTAGGVIS